MPQIDCPNCGAPVESGERACPYCGAAISAQTEPAAPTVQIDRDLFSGNIGLNTNDAEQFREVRELARAGNKIEAIKVYREMTGVGLKEAKDAVEAIESGQPIIVSQATIIAGSALSGATAFNNSAEAMDAIKAELRKGNKIEAVKIYRQYFNVGLKEAKDAVDQTETDLKYQAAPISDSEPPAFARPETPAVEPNVISSSSERPAWQKWAIGCVAASVILCICACLPLIAVIVSRSNGG